MLEQCEITKENGKDRPVYEQISKHIRKQIGSKFAIGDRLPSMAQMVKRWDVGYNTVKAAIEELEQEGILKRGDKRGEGPLVVGKGERKVSAKPAFCYFRRYHDAFELQMSAGIKRFAEESGADVVVVDLKESLKILNIVDLVKPRFVIVKPENEKKFIDEIQTLQQCTEVVFVDDYLPGINISSVSADHVDGTYQATKHLLECHNSPVYYFGHTNNNLVVQFRLDGWATAMREYGFANIEKYIFEIPYLTEFSGHNAYYSHYCKKSEELLKKIDVFPCSLFTLNDYAAQSIYEAADAIGKQIGKDIFVASFGNLPLCQNLPVKLTSIDQNNENVGYEAARLLMNQSCLSKEGGVHIKIPVKLVTRESSISCS